MQAVDFIGSLGKRSLCKCLMFTGSICVYLAWTFSKWRINGCVYALDAGNDDTEDGDSGGKVNDTINVDVSDNVNYNVNDNTNYICQ